MSEQEKMPEPELERKIAAWRARLSAALPGQEETVRELEEHLRDHIGVQVRRGMPAEQAFAEGVAKLGPPRALAREFAQVEGAGAGAGEVYPLNWYAARPTVVIYGLVGTGWAAIAAMMTWNVVALHRSPLLAIHVVAMSGGYLAMVAAGLVGLWALLPGGSRTPTDRARQTQRREIFRMSVTGGVLVPLGMVLGMIWINGDGGVVQRPWSWAPLEIGALAVLVSTWLLLLIQLKPGLAGIRGRAVLAVIVAAIATVAWFAKGLAPILPYPWLCAALVLIHGAVALQQA
ncbi:MAG: permease prefix domain 1-containing protein, partial [Verrucomicrobia bacterium]|nr:permease prefix domain 1-containing protein [Verrucomicrobiota bacterium]